MENRIREIREVLGITQADLARRSGLDKPTISNIEAGKRSPQLDTATKIARGLGAKDIGVVFPGADLARPVPGKAIAA